MHRFAILCSVLILVSVSATNVKQCTKGRPSPMSVDVEGCDVTPCIVIKGSTVVMKVNFLGIRDNTKKIRTIIHATTFGITVPYMLPDNVADVCNNLLYGAICPIYRTEDVVYNFNFDIDSSYPEISVKVEVDLVDEHDQSIACFTVDIKVRKSSSAKLLNNTMGALE